MKTASGAVAVKIVCCARCGSRSIEYLGSAHDDEELEALKAAARQSSYRRVPAVACAGCGQPAVS